MFTLKKVDYTQRRKVAAEMRMDGYISMVEISANSMSFQYRNLRYTISAVPSEIKKYVDESGEIAGYKLYFGGSTYKYWYRLEDLVKLPWTKEVSTKYHSIFGG